MSLSYHNKSNKSNNKTVKNKMFRGGEDPNPQNPTGEQNQPQDPSQMPQQDPSQMQPQDPSQMPQQDPSEQMPQQDPSEQMPQQDPSQMQPQDPSQMQPQDPSEQIQPQEEQQMPPQEEQQMPPSEQMSPQEQQQMPPSEQMQPQEEQQQMPQQEEEQQIPPSGQSQEGESTEITEFRKKTEEPDYEHDYFYKNVNISTEQNRDKSYKREGVLHFTDSVSTNANQNAIMSLGGLIGSKGIENSTYDKLRNIALQKVGILLGDNRRCYNTRIEFERNGDTIFVHIYGSLYVKKGQQ